MALPPPPSCIVFLPATPWPSKPKPSPKVRAKRKPGDLVWHTECSQCEYVWLEARRPKDTLYCRQCDRAGLKHIPLKTKWLGPGPMPAKRKPAAIIWQLVCPACAMTYSYSRRPRDGYKCGSCPPSTRCLLSLKWLGPGPMPDRKS